MTSLLANVNKINNVKTQNLDINKSIQPQAVVNSIPIDNSKDVFVSEKSSNEQVKQNNNRSKRNKIIVAIVGGAILTPILIGIGALKYQSHYLKKAQKVFQNAFMRDDITNEETKQILERYRKINEIQNVDKFIEALFNEAKKNFGFENSNICLEKTSMKKGIAGLADTYKGIISINKDFIRGRSGFINFIHHEFRHFKQQYLAANLSFDDLIKSQIEGINASDCEQIIKDYARQSITKSIMERDLLHVFNLDCFDIVNVPVKLRDFAQKVIDTTKDTVLLEQNIKKNPSNKAFYRQYRKCFIEDDAFYVGESMKKLLRFIIPI